MNLKSIENFKKSFWDWSLFNDCFGDTKIRISDVDGIAERNGQILFIEAKSHGAVIPTGQKLLHKALLATGVVTLLYIWGNPNETASLVEIHHRDGRTTVRKNVTIQQLQGLISKWFEFANAMPKLQFS